MDFFKLTAAQKVSLTVFDFHTYFDWACYESLDQPTGAFKIHGILIRWPFLPVHSDGASFFCKKVRDYRRKTKTANHTSTFWPPWIKLLPVAWNVPSINQSGESTRWCKAEISLNKYYNIRLCKCKKNVDRQEEINKDKK